ncbi:MAG: pirin family protein [Pseudoxanthomonas sp.]
MNTVATTPAPARVARKVRGMATSDGAGVKLTRVIGGQDLPELDPFLLLDEFGTDQAEDYIAGFPSHPHRGFETVTYMLDGRMRHKDNHGNEGLLTPGSVQWMTAGRGLVHSEMPEQESGRMRGFQLWVNLPASDKMTDPKYQEFSPENIPVATPAAGILVKVIAGSVGEVIGPIVQPATDPVYLDVSLEAGKSWEYALPEGHNAFAYVFEGAASVGKGDDARVLETHEMAVLGGGDLLQLQASGAHSTRLIVVAGRPLREPVMRHGPFVMNTRQELMQAFVDFQEGRF